MVKKLRKLRLAKDTVRQLEAGELRGAWIGGGSANEICQSAANDVCTTQAISCTCSAPRTCTVLPNC